MKHIGIIPNTVKDADLSVTNHIIKWLNEHGFVPYLDKSRAKLVQGHINVASKSIYDASDMLIVIGGDGTILSAASCASKQSIPILGVNLGRLGFIADIEPYEIDNALEKLFIRKSYKIEERMMLKATVVNKDGKKKTFHALNDINITRGSFARLIKFKILVNSQLCDIYPADGVIVATPTGSTAYNLSAGGPILVPHTNNFVLTPICPHTIYSKSIILSESDKLCIVPMEETKDVALSLDGRFMLYIEPTDEIYVESSEYVTKLIKLSDREFFEILRHKIVERKI